ncbi:cytochrome c1 [Pseudomonas oryzihabitans]|uniref:cytochrome c1 n=1 Tax=Pseudomonas oryzihabitans TaxID=47885 RepID=UPI002895E813|nr:cytochrome c1 [Pseudomonas oryzihabitans]MDT3721782.1 cytochrome c1 [Pseudomonas oryzihabitans]
MRYLLLSLLLLCTGLAGAAEPGDPRAGAITFGRYCLACHGQEYQRFDRVAADLHLDLASWAPGRTASAPMLGLLKPEDARRAFGSVPPDLTLIAVVRGEAWLRAFLQEFYVAPDRPLGVDNLAAPGTRMPDVLAALRGRQLRDCNDGRCVLRLESGSGAQTPEQFARTVEDLVAYLGYSAAPERALAWRLAPWVLGYLVLFAILAFWLKRQFWRRLPDSER